MNSKNRFLLALFLIAAVFTSCQDDYFNNLNNGATNMQNLKVSKDFNWSTAKTVTVTISGLPTQENSVTQKATLTLNGDTTIFYSGLHAINENQHIVLVVPAKENTIKLKFGSIVLSGIIVDNKVEFSLIPILTEDN